jgi:nicotinate-nucleotide adenylyltransferase
MPRRIRRKGRRNSPTVFSYLDVGVKIGLYGGTFDPVHIAHLIIAERVRDTLHLDRVMFIPCAIPPHKLADGIATGAQRLTMLNLAIAGNPYFAVDDLELQRQGKSYTIDTVRQIIERHELAPGELHLIIGADNLRDFGSWRSPEEIASLCQLVVVERPHVMVPVLPGYVKRLHRVAIPLMGVSSTGLREMVRRGESIRYQVVPAVEQYIVSNKLYLS